MTAKKSTEVAPTSGGALQVASDQREWDPAQVAALRQIGLEEATPEDMQVLLHMAQRTGLDPFARQIYMIGRNSKNERTNRWEKKYTIQTGIDGFRVIAERSGKYAGQTGPEWCGPDGQWRDVWLDAAPPAAARVGVLRVDFTEPAYAVAVFSEYAQTTKDGGLTAMWKSKASVMIAKCAEALALRKAFPQDLSGLYTSDEMAQVNPVVDAPPAALPDDFDALVTKAEEESDRAALLDLHALATAAGHQVKVAEVVAAGKRVAAILAAAESEEVVDGEVADGEAEDGQDEGFPA